MVALAKQHNSIIPAHQHRACELRYEGTTSEEIARVLLEQFNYRTSGSAIRHWFCKNGILYDYYNGYAEQQNDERQRLAMDVFKANIDKAQGALAMVMSGKKGFGVPQVLAAKEWLDRGLGKVADKVKLDARVGVYNFADWALQQAEILKNHNATANNRPSTPAAKVQDATN